MSGFGAIDRLPVVSPYDKAPLETFVLEFLYGEYDTFYGQLAEGKAIDVILGSGIRLATEAFSKWGIDSSRANESLWRAATHGALETARSYETALFVEKPASPTEITKELEDESRRRLLVNGGNPVEALGAMYIVDIVRKMEAQSSHQRAKAGFKARARAFYVGYVWLHL